MPPPVAAGGNDCGRGLVLQRVAAVANELGAADVGRTVAVGFNANAVAQETRAANGRVGTVKQAQTDHAVHDLDVLHAKVPAAHRQGRCRFAAVGGAGVAYRQVVECRHTVGGCRFLDAHPLPVACPGRLRHGAGQTANGVVLLAGQRHTATRHQLVSNHQLRIRTKLHHHARRQLQRRPIRPKRQRLQQHQQTQTTQTQATTQ